MKKLITYLNLLLIGLLLFGCDKPAPTELFDDSSEESAQYEVLSKDLGNDFYSNGFDTTGVTQDLNSLVNLISVSGIKVTRANGMTDRFSIAQTIFFDKSKPIFYTDGRLLAYQTITPGIIRFDNIMSRIVPFRIHYKDNGMLRDTLLGNRYILYSGRHGGMDQFHYRHNSFINFRINVFNGNEANFNILTPKEVFGQVHLQGSRNNKDLRAVLNWNKADAGKFSIILGARLRNREKVMPLFRVRTNDDGELIVPARFIAKIPFDRFDKLVFTFIRRFEHHEQVDANNDLYISSQSIHSITVNYP